MFFEHPGGAPADDERRGEVNDDFEGLAPLFPLGRLTLLPNVVQPFHLFEPRYRQMGADAVEGDGYLALGILRPDRPQDYESKNASVFPHVCLGRIMQYEPLPEGRWNLIVQGLWRAKVVDEIDDGSPYRTARLDVLPEQAAESQDDFDADRHGRHLIELFQRARPQLAGNAVVRDILDRDLPLGLAADFIAHALDLSPACGASLLEENCAARRCQFLEALLETYLRKKAADDRPFPPEFSAN